jgi:starch-binding outer membrane protein, SusD/RagB family
MRKTLARYLPVLALLGGAACTDLMEAPYTEITEANFKPTADDLVRLIAPVYTVQRNIWMSWYGMVDWQGETGDMLLTPVRPNGWYDGGIYIQNHEHQWNADAPGMPNSLWGNAFNGINAANRVIYQIESGVIPLEVAVATAAVAELRAMRAWYYYLLLDNFGNIPISTDFTSRELPGQVSRQEALDFVVTELNEAIPNLPAAVNTSTYGRMHSWAAKAVLVRLYLNYEAYTGTPRYDRVLELTREIIDSNLFQLDASYRTPFSRNNFSASKEIIFAVPYDQTYGGSNFHMKTLKPDLRFALKLNAQPWGGTAANPQFIDTYDPDDGRLADSWLMGPHYDDQERGYTFLKHVPQILRARQNCNNGTVTDTVVCFNHGFPVWKYEIYEGMTGGSEVDFPAIRYAEILMARAEALLRTGDAGGAATLVTQVRQRNFTGAAAGKATVTGAELMQGSRYNYGWYDTDGIVKSGRGGTPTTGGGADIQYGRFLDELRWEFPAEAQDRQMLIRFGVFTTKTWFNHVPNGDYRVIFAIPQSRLNTNENLTQNPGY